MALQIDLVLEEDNCNLRCEYCMIRMKPTVTRDTLDIDATMELIANARKIEPAPIVRLSGGEIFLFKNIIEFLEELQSHVPVIEIITNGTFLDEAVIAELAPIDNLHIKFSLDGHCFEMNSQRFRSERVFTKIFENFLTCLNSDLGLSIFCVVSNCNTDRLVEFVGVANQWPRPIPIYFLPVRHAYGKDLTPSSKPFLKLAENYEEHQRVLFSKSYVTNLADFVASQNRSLPCYAQKHIVGLSQEGEVHMCPCGFPGSRGNVNDGTISPPMDGINHGYCKGCFTDYDVLSLFEKGELTLQELSKDTVYTNPEVRRTIGGIFAKSKT